MKLFFYAVLAVYLFLYFYAVYAYEGFNLGTALSVLITLGILGWLLLRGWHAKAMQQGNESGEVMNTNAKALRWFQSPIPYLAGILLIAFISFVVF